MRVEDFFELIVSYFGFVFGLDANVLFSDDVFGDLKGEDDFLDEYRGLLTAGILISNKELEERNGFFLYNIKSLFLDGDA